MIVLNENDWAAAMIREHSLGKKPFETLSRVARYYLEHGYSKKSVRELLDRFLIQCEPTASLIKWSSTVDNALARAIKRPSVQIEHIVITQPEMEKIKSISGRQAQRLAFTLLCLAKYWDAVIPDSDHWVNSDDSEIMKLANISTSVKRQGMLYYTLRELGLIRFSKKIDNTNVRVCFIEDGPPALYVDDFRNVGYQYLKYNGEPYIKCEMCGLVVKKNNAGKDRQSPMIGRPQKYCKDCAVKIKLRQNVESIMRKKVRAVE